MTARNTGERERESRRSAHGKISAADGMQRIAGSVWMKTDEDGFRTEEQRSQRPAQLDACRGSRVAGSGRSVAGNGSRNVRGSKRGRERDEVEGEEY